MRTGLQQWTDGACPTGTTRAAVPQGEVEEMAVLEVCSGGQAELLVQGRLIVTPTPTLHEDDSATSGGTCVMVKSWTDIRTLSPPEWCYQRAGANCETSYFRNPSVRTQIKRCLTLSNGACGGEETFSECPADPTYTSYPRPPPPLLPLPPPPSSPPPLPPPPSHPSPSPPPPSFGVSIEITLAGNLEDVTEGDKAAIKRKFANEFSRPLERIDVLVRAGSVILTVTLSTDNAAATLALDASISASGVLDTAAAAQSWLRTAVPDLNVLSAPTRTPMIASPSPPPLSPSPLQPPPPPSPSRSDTTTTAPDAALATSDGDDRSVIYIAAAAGVAALVLVLLLVLAHRRTRRALRNQERRVDERVGELQTRTQRAVIETHRKSTSFSRKLFSQHRTPTASAAGPSDRACMTQQQQAWLEQGVTARQEDDALGAQLDDDEAAIAGVLHGRSVALDPEEAKELRI